MKLAKLKQVKSRISRRPEAVRGQSLIEFALLLPLLFLLMINVINFGGMFFAWIAVSDAARGGVQYWSAGGTTLGGITAANAGDVATFVNAELHRLPNSSSITVCVCTTTPTSSSTTTTSCKKDATTTCTPSAGNPPADPGSGEAGIFAVGSVDVTYTYQPYISLFNFSALKIHLTTPPTSIHRRAIMRIN